MKKHDLFRLVRIFSLILLWAGADTVHLSAQCTGEVLNISAPTHSTSGTTANWTVPSGGPYKVKITTKGAKGGAGISNGTSYPGSKGATMVGEFILLAGQNIQTVAGAPGGDAIISADGGGGGGTSVRIGSGSLLLVAGGGGGGSQQTSSQGGQVGSGNGQGGAGNIGAGGGGLLSAGGTGFTNGNGNAPTGGGAGFNATGGLGRVNSYVSGNGGGGFGGGGGGNTLGFGGGGGGGYTGGVGGSVISFITTGGGGSYNVGANQNNTADANNAGGQVIIECLGTAALTATATATQPVCATPTQGSASIDLTGDLNGYPSGGLEYAVVSGGTFSGSPTFADVLADPFSITSGTGTVADLDGETYTVRVRVKYSLAVFVDVTYTLTSPVPQRTWTGALSTDWHTAGNWNPTCVPTASDDVTIPDVTNDPTISAVAVAKSVRVSSGAVLTISVTGSFTINGFITIPASPTLTSALNNLGTITNNGILDIGSGSSAGWSGIYNSNTIYNNADGLIRINNTSDDAFWNTSNAAIMVNSGMLEIGAIAAVSTGIINQGSFTNTLSGAISINNAANRGISNFVAPGFTNFGTITIGANGNVGEFAIRSSSTPVANSGCSALIKVLSNSIIFNNGSTIFTNSGTIIENASGNSGITNNSGTVQNLNYGTFDITNNTGVLTTATGDLWTGCTSTDWYEPTNWHDGTVPTASDDVTIPDVTNDPIISAVAVAKSVAVDANASLTIAAASSLTIEGSTGFPSGGMYNLGTVTNNGTILAGPNVSPGQYGIVNEATFNNNAGAEVKIDRASNMGFWNRTTAASLTNAGTITIGGTANVNGAGIYNEGDVQNTGGEIRIDRFNGAGLHNLSNSTVTNSGKILIGKTALSSFASGIYNFGHIQNSTAGEIEVDRTTSGIYNTTSGIINSSFTNEGKIAIGQTAAVSGPGIYNYTFTAGLISFENKSSGEILLDRTQTGIDNDDNSTFNNSGLIKIGTTGALTGINPGIFNKGTFDNDAIAEIRIDAVPQSGLDNRGTFTNGGKIIVGINVTNTSFNPGVFNEATFVNQVNAELHIDRFTRTGFYNYANCTLTNAGLIKIGENVLGGEHGLYNYSGTVNNQADGEIHVDNISDANNTNGVYNGFNTNFTNAGKVFIGTAVGAGSTGLYNYGTFGNSGEIRVDNVRGTSNRHGLRNDIGSFTNTGKITLGGSATVGDWGLYSTTTFNNTGGEISIDRCNITGLRNELSTFTNTGSIALGSNANIGSWGLWNRFTFNNNTGGEISIDRTSNTGLLIYSGTFNNNGAVTIGAETAVGDQAIYNESTLTNGACAQLNIFAPLHNVSTLTNLGLLQSNTTAPHTNTGFTNNGIIAYPQGNPIPNVTNNEIIISPTTFNGCSNISPAFTLGTPLDMTVLGVFTDAAATISAGSYDTATNTFTPTTTLAVGTYNFFVKIQDGSGGCTRVVPWQLNLQDMTPPSITCPNDIPCVEATSPVGAVVFYSSPTATDNCDGNVPVNAVLPSGSTFFVGVNTVVATAFDSQGNSAICAFTVQVCDRTPPTIQNMPNNISCVVATSPSGAVVTYTNPTATDIVDVTVPVTCVPASGSVFPIGSTTVVCTAMDAFGNIASSSFVVSVDGTPPTITCPANANVPAGANCTASLASYTAAATANDNCTVNPTKVQSPAAGTTITGSQIVTLTATDGANNSATCTFTVTVVDQTAPSITCPNNIPCVEATSPSGAVVFYSSPTATDNCAGNVPVNAVLPSGSTFFVGVNTVVATAFDSQGNSAICAFTVQVCDRTPPTIQNTPNNIPCVAATSPSGAVVTYTNPTATDIVDVTVPVTCVPASGSVFPIGSTTVVCTAMDAFGNIASSSFVVSVDGTPPTITCPANATVPAGANCMAALASYTAAATANDDCTANPTKVQSPVSGTMIAGSQIVTLTATDGANNSATCSFTVTVVDQTAPSITCPANASVPANANCAASLLSYTAAATANDNCTANPSKMQSPVSGTTIAGSQIVTLTATDGANNSATCSFTVTVVDQTAPSITCPANATVLAGANCTAALASYTAAATANDNCTANPTKVQSPVAGTTIAGSQIVTLTATDGANNSATCSFTVTVVDNTPPTVICKNFTANLNTVGTASITTANVFQSGSDNCGNVNLVNVVPNAFTCANIGVRTVVLTVSDGSSNTATCSAIVNVADATVPTIICPANIIRANDLNQCSASVVYATPIASDNCAGAVASHFSGGVSGAVFQKGTTTVVWRATDGVGLTSSCSFSITINDTQKPNITCPANQTRSTDPGLCSAVVTYPTPKGTDNCGLPTGQPVWLSGGTAPTASGANSIATFQRGINTVTWRATDGAGLTNTCTFRVTVNDTEAPALTCPVAINLFTATNTCNAIATYTNPTFTDNCAPTMGTATRISGLVSGSAFPLGNSNVVFQATDAAGNTRRCTMVVTVTDNQPPVITCPTPVVVNGTGSPCAATVFYGSATASDNCAGTLIPFLVTGLASGSSFPVGVTTNTFRAVAPNGQSSSCSFAVTVNCGNGMGNTGTEVRDADLGIAQNSNLDLTLAPNPALSTVTVSIDGVGAGGGTLLVFDAVGRLVLRQVIAENQRTAVFQVDDSAFAPGLYRVNLRATNGTVTKTLVVVKQ